MELAGAVIFNQALGATEAAPKELEAVVRDHSRLVYKVAFAVLRNPQDAEDAAQETFLRVLKYQKQLPEVREIRGWLARIAWRVAVDRSKDRGNDRSKDRSAALEVADDSHPELADPSASAEQMAIQKDHLRRLHRLIAGLPGGLRDALILSTIEEMSSEEVAKILGIPEAAVRGRVFRARQILKQKFSAQLERPRIGGENL